MEEVGIKCRFRSENLAGSRTRDLLTRLFFVASYTFLLILHITMSLLSPKLRCNEDVLHLVKGPG